MKNHLIFEGKQDKQMAVDVMDKSRLEFHKHGEVRTGSSGCRCHVHNDSFTYNELTFH